MWKMLETVAFVMTIILFIVVVGLLVTSSL